MNAQGSRQRGTILITALILLLVLTMLGVTAMNTTSLQEKMSSNLQAIHRAFQAAESGIDLVIIDGNALVPGSTTNAKTSLLGNYGAGANMTVKYLRDTPPPRTSLYSASSFVAYHFDIESRAGSEATDTPTTLNFADNAASVTLHAGVYQIGKKR